MEDGSTFIAILIPFIILGGVCIIAGFVGTVKHGSRQEMEMVLREDDKVIIKARGFGEDDTTMELFYEMENHFSDAQTLKTMDKWLENMEYVYEKNKHFLSKEHDEYCARSIASSKEERQELADEIAEKKARQREERRRQAQQEKARQNAVNLQK